MKPVDFQRTFAMNIITSIMLYDRCTNYIIPISKKDAIHSTMICDFHQQLNNIKVCHIYIFNIEEYNAYSPCYSE